MAFTDSLLNPPRRYLRYLHLREAVRLSRPASVLVIGAGRCDAEIAIANDFPDLRFHVTDWAFRRTRLERARGLARGRTNVSFGELDIMAPELDEKFDLVASVEVLEHLKDDDRAASNMRALSSKHVFCLVPFARPCDNANAKRRRRVWENNEHYVVGYDPKRLMELFPDPVEIRGAYWADVSIALKREVEGLSPEQVLEKADRLKWIAEQDLRPDIPKTMKQAMGIWTLADA